MSEPWNWFISGFVAGTLWCLIVDAVMRAREARRLADALRRLLKSWGLR